MREVGDARITEFTGQIQTMMASFLEGRGNWLAIQLASNASSIVTPFCYIDEGKIAAVGGGVVAGREEVALGILQVAALDLAGTVDWFVAALLGAGVEFLVFGRIFALSRFCIF